jgi:hypothetical protein
MSQETRILSAEGGHQGRREAGECDLTARMVRTLKRVGLVNWRVCWVPDESFPYHGRAIPEELLIEIHDEDEVEAWETFIHEVLEIKFRLALRPYMVLVNKLIEGYQLIVDGEKERFLEELPHLFRQLNHAAGPQDSITHSGRVPRD